MLKKPRASIVATAALLLGTSAPAAGQAAAESIGARPPPPQPAFTVSAGLSTDLGWLGGSVEHYFLGGRLSGAVGAGYVPETDEGNPDTAAFGAALRGYMGGDEHRAFVELSASLLSLSWTRLDGTLVDFDRNYGPGLSAGYRYTASGGFTLIAGAGAGWAVNTEDIEPIRILGVGYTWRR